MGYCCENSGGGFVGFGFFFLVGWFLEGGADACICLFVFFEKCKQKKPFAWILWLNVDFLGLAAGKDLSYFFTRATLCVALV